MCEIINEEWRDIKGYEGHYQVSNFGRVRSLTYSHYHFGMKKIVTKDREMVLKQYIHYKGYRFVSFGVRERKTRKHYFIHRLVAQAFIVNPESKPFVNHIDCNKSHNCLTNLNWMTESENTSYHYAQVKARPNNGHF